GRYSSFRLREHRHYDQRDDGEKDTGKAFHRGLVRPKRTQGVVRYVQSENDKAYPHETERGSFGAFPPMRVALVVKAPKKRRAGSDFNQAVETKADKSHTSSKRTRRECDQRFQTVPRDREIFEPA